jgi:hypothetical protein
MNGHGSRDGRAGQAGVWGPRLEAIRRADAEQGEAAGQHDPRCLGQPQSRPSCLVEGRPACPRIRQQDLRLRFNVSYPIGRLAGCSALRVLYRALVVFGAHSG